MDQVAWAENLRSRIMFPSPCGGEVVMDLNKRNTYLMEALPKLFPSPCGGEVVMDSLSTFTQKQMPFGFPSPCGGEVVMDVEWNSYDEDYLYWTVSIPLRGRGSHGPYP